MKGKNRTHLEDKLLMQILNANLPVPDREVRFHDSRRWRFDFAYTEIMLAIEVEGGVWNKGRHTRPVGFEADCEKYNEAAVDGWSVLRVTGKMINSGMAIDQLTRLYDFLYRSFTEE